MSDSPAPIATPEEVAAAEAALQRHHNWLTREQFEWALSDVEKERRAALRTVLSALSTLKEENERLTRERDEARHAFAAVINDDNIGLQWVELHTQVATLTETVGRLREALTRAKPFLDTLDAYDEVTAALSTEPTKET